MAAEQKVNQCKASIIELQKEIQEQEKQLERINHKCAVVESENKTLQSLISRRQTELDKLLIEKEQMFLHAQEIDRSSPVKPLPEDPAPTSVTSALMNYFSQQKPEEVKEGESPKEQEEVKELFMEDDVDIKDELQKLGLIDIVKKY